MVWWSQMSNLSIVYIFVQTTVGRVLKEVSGSKLNYVVTAADQTIAA